MDVIYFPFGDAFTCIELYKRNVQELKLVYRGKYASIKKNTIWAGLKCFYDQIWEFVFDHIFRKCRVYVYNQGLFPAFVIENRHALSLEFSLKRNLFAGSCHEDGRSAAFIALTSILLAARTFSSKRLEFIFELFTVPVPVTLISSFRTIQITRPQNHNIPIMLPAQAS